MMDSMARLQAEQDELRTLAGELRAFAGLDIPPPRAALNDARWRFARTLLRHLPHKDRMVYARLRRHRDPAVVAIAERYSDEAHMLYKQFEQHSARWTPEEVEAQWGSYRFGVMRLTDMLRDRIAREEAELLPHLSTAPEVPPARSATDRNWAAAGWTIRDQLGLA